MLSCRLPVLTAYCRLPTAYSPSTLRQSHRVQAAEDDALAALDAAEVLLRIEDVERAWNHRREEGGLLWREAGGGLAEVGLRRGLRAVDAVAPLDDVEVDFQYPTLRERTLQKVRDGGLLDLTRRRPLRREVEVLGELL